MSCSAMISKREIAISSNFRFISRTNLLLSWVENEKKTNNLGAWAGIKLILIDRNNALSSDAALK